MPLTRWILYGKIRILQRTGRASPNLPAEIFRRVFEKLNENAGQIKQKGRSGLTKKETMRYRKEIRLSAAEHEKLQKDAAEMGVTESRFLRMLLTDRPRDHPQVREELRRLNNEVNHIGVNINQIVHNNNSRLYSEVDKHRLYVYMKQVKDLLNQILDKL